MLIHFPTANQESKLPSDKMLDLLEFRMPSSWQKAMILQDFDPLDHTLTELVNFCERLELTEPEVKKKSSLKTSHPHPLQERKGKLDSIGIATTLSREIASSMARIAVIH